MTGYADQFPRLPAMSSVHTARYKEFLRRLKAARLAAGMTQAQAARRLSKPQSFVSKCESGERRVDMIELEAMAKVYGKRLTYFLPNRKRPRNRA